VATSTPTDRPAHRPGRTAKPLIELLSCANVRRVLTRSETIVSDGRHGIPLEALSTAQTVVTQERRYVPAPIQRDWLSLIGTQYSASPETSLTYKSTCRQRCFYKESGRSFIILLVARRYQEPDTARVVPTGPSVTADRNDGAAPLRGPPSSVGRVGRARLTNRHKRPTEWRPRRVRPEGGPLLLRWRSRPTNYTNSVTDSQRFYCQICKPGGLCP